MFEIATTPEVRWLFYLKGMPVLKMIAPIALIVGSNCIYHICAKSVPEQMNTFGALAVTYLVATVFSAILFCMGVGPSHMGEELTKINWAPIVLGIVIVGLEAGYVLLYRSGMPVSQGAVIANICLAVALLVIGFALYHEAITIKQVIGIVVCGVGLFLVTT